MLQSTHSFPLTNKKSKTGSYEQKIWAWTQIRYVRHIATARPLIGHSHRYAVGSRSFILLSLSCPLQIQLDPPRSEAGHCYATSAETRLHFRNPVDPIGTSPWPRKAGEKHILTCSAFNTPWHHVWWKVTTGCNTSSLIIFLIGNRSFATLHSTTKPEAPHSWNNPEKFSKR